MFPDKHDAERIMAGMTAAERRQFLDKLIICLTDFIEVSHQADLNDQKNPVPPFQFWKN